MTASPRIIWEEYWISHGVLSHCVFTISHGEHINFSELLAWHDGGGLIFLSSYS